MSKVIDINEQLKTKKIGDDLKKGKALYITTKDENGNLKKYKMTLKNGEVP